MKANLKFYEDKEQTIIADLARYGRQSGILSFLRLITFLGAAGLFIGGYAANLPVLYFAGGAVFILFVVFSYFIPLFIYITIRCGCELIPFSIYF